MMKSFAIFEKAGTVVYHSLTEAMAAAVCDQLEGAGMPACLGKVTSGFAVMVPAKFSAQSRRLLIAQPHRPEIFYKLS
jgi:hypothetical protein